MQSESQQTPSTQEPEAHCASCVQAVPFARPVVGTEQTPPVQLLPALQSVSEAHEARQAPLPLQNVPPHSPLGSVPARTGVQRPGLPGAAQDSQLPPQGALQQTLSTQWPEPQSQSALHAVPFSWLPAGSVQAPWRQAEVGLQSAFPVQLAVHPACPLQR